MSPARDYSVAVQTPQLTIHELLIKPRRTSASGCCKSPDAV